MLGDVQGGFRKARITEDICDRVDRKNVLRYGEPMVCM